MKRSTLAIEKQFSVIRLCVGFCIKFILWAMLGGLIALVISCVLLTVVGEAHAFRYIHALIAGQYHYLSNSLFTTLTTFPLQCIRLLFNAIHPINFLESNFNFHMMPWLSASAQNKALSVTHPFLVHTQILFSAYGKILLLTLELMLLRLGVVVGMLPLFFLFGIIGIIEGLVARDIRRFSGGRESALIYHRAKKYIPVTFLMSSFLYLSLPINSNPQWFFVPGAVLFAIAIATTLRSFKKYV